MDNFTPLKSFGQKKKKISKFLLFTNIFLMMFVVGLTGYYLQNQLISRDSQAGCRKNSTSANCQRINFRQRVYKGGYAGEYTATVNLGTPQNPVSKKVVPVWFTSADGRAYIIKNTSVGPGGTLIQSDDLKQALDKAGLPPNFIDGGSCMLPNGGHEINDYCIAPGNCNTTTTNGGMSTAAGGAVNPNENCNVWHYSICPVGIPPYCTESGGPEGDTAPTPTRVPTATPTPTRTIITNTPTPTPTATSTPTPTITPFISNTPTATPVISNTPTATPVISNTPTATPTATSTPAPGTPTVTPTEIILAKVSASPTVVVSLLKTGMVKSFMYWIPGAIMLVGLLL